jgi:hypothetical protein
MNYAKRKILNLIINALLMFAFILVVINVALSLYVFNLTDSSNAKFILLPNEQYENSKDLFKTLQMHDIIISEKQKDEFTKKLIKEYIVERFSISLVTDLMERKFSFAPSNTINLPISISKILYMSIYSTQNSFGISREWTKFNSGDKREIQGIIKQGMTRSVQILEEPRKNKDVWTTKVKFIYKTFDADRRNSSLEEVYSINTWAYFGNAVNNFRNFRTAVYPSVAFKFYVDKLDKVKEVDSKNIVDMQNQK